MDDVGRAAGIGRVTGILLYCWVALEIVMILTCADFIAGAGENVWFATAPIVLAINGIVALAMLIVAVFLAIWVYRTMAVARRLTPTLTITPGWAVGWFFVPVANLWKPHVVMTEIAEGSGDKRADYHKSGRRLIDLWWAAWIARSFCGLIVSVMTRAPRGVNLTVSSVIFILLSAVFGIVAALLLEAIIRRVTRLQAGAVNAAIFD